MVNDDPNIVAPQAPKRSLVIIFILVLCVVLFLGGLVIGSTFLTLKSTSQTVSKNVVVSVTPAVETVPVGAHVTVSLPVDVEQQSVLSAGIAYRVGGRVGSFTQDSSDQDIYNLTIYDSRGRPLSNVFKVDKTTVQLVFIQNKTETPALFEDVKKDTPIQISYYQNLKPKLEGQVSKIFIEK